MWDEVQTMFAKLQLGSDGLLRLRMSMFIIIIFNWSHDSNQVSLNHFINHIIIKMDKKRYRMKLFLMSWIEAPINII